MGFYINPVGETKESWLQKNGRRLSGVPNTYRDGNDIAVCLVDNGRFTAAAIAVNPRELDAFRYPDGRPKTWFFVDQHKLVPFLKDYKG